MSYELPAADPGIDKSAREDPSGPARDLPEQEGDCIVRLEDVAGAANPYSVERLD
jgi:hypothetical protein